MFEIKRLDVLLQTPKRFDSNAEAFLKFAFAKIFFAAAYFIRLLIQIVIRNKRKTDNHVFSFSKNSLHSCHSVDNPLIFNASWCREPYFSPTLPTPPVSVSAILYCDVWLLLVPLLCIIEK